MSLFTITFDDSDGDEPQQKPQQPPPSPSKKPGRRPIPASRKPKKVVKPIIEETGEEDDDEEENNAEPVPIKIPPTTGISAPIIPAHITPIPQETTTSTYQFIRNVTMSIRGRKTSFQLLQDGIGLFSAQISGVKSELVNVMDRDNKITNTIMVSDDLMQFSLREKHTFGHEMMVIRFTKTGSTVRVCLFHPIPAGLHENLHSKIENEKDSISIWDQSESKCLIKMVLEQSNVLVMTVVSLLPHEYIFAFGLSYMFTH